jgi:MinD-like ATPase involved in chromosome partitioning or flagellar assembly
VHSSLAKKRKSRKTNNKKAIFLGRVIGVFSGKGGVGKTTIALNLAAAVSHNFKKDTTIIDCNLTAAHLGLHLGMYETPSTLNNVLRDEINISDAMHVHHTGMNIIPASISMKDLSGVDASRIREVVKGISNKSNIVILDGSPGFGREAIFVTTPNVPSVMDVIRFHEISDTLDAKPIGIVLNMVGKDKHELKPREIEDIAEMPIISKIPYDNSINKSLHFKEPVITHHPRARSSREIIKLASSIVGESFYEKNSWLETIKSVFSFQRR